MKIFWEMKVSIELLPIKRVAEILFATILKLTEFFDAIYKFHEGRNQKKNPEFNFISGRNDEFGQICGLAKKINSTLANMGQSQSLVNTSFMWHKQGCQRISI